MLDRTAPQLSPIWNWPQNLFNQNRQQLIFRMRTLYDFQVNLSDIHVLYVFMSSFYKVFTENMAKYVIVMIITISCI